MLILIGIVPGFFALNNAISPESLSNSFANIETVMHAIDSTQLAAPDRKKLAQTFDMHNRLTTKLNNTADVELIPRSERFDIRKDIMVMDRNLNGLLKKEELAMSDLDKATLKKSLKEVRTITDFAPQWVVLLISFSLGIGTMIGWKRIVRTIGEKIGKEHLTYAQGASAELVATSTIGISTYLGLPVSTTHVLSSGIAGSMVASKGIKNLQGDTVRNILIAWFLTLPVVLILSGTLFLLFRSLI
jgi:PiT family inorganic phosphate transporter